MPAASPPRATYHASRASATSGVAQRPAARFASGGVHTRDASESDATVASSVLAAFEDYLRAYLQLVADAAPLEGAAAKGAVRDAQLSYAEFRTGFKAAAWRGTGVR